MIPWPQPRRLYGWRQALANDRWPPAFWNPRRQSWHRPLEGEFSLPQLLVSRTPQQLIHLATPSHELMVWDRHNPYQFTSPRQTEILEYFNSHSHLRGYPITEQPVHHSCHHFTGRIRSLQAKMADLFQTRKPLPGPLATELEQLLWFGWKLDRRLYPAAAQQIDVTLRLMNRPGSEAELEFANEIHRDMPSWASRNLMRLLVTYWGTTTHFFPLNHIRPNSTMQDNLFYFPRKGSVSIHFGGYGGIRHRGPDPHTRYPRLQWVIDFLH